MAHQLGEPDRPAGVYSVTAISSGGDTVFAKQFRYSPTPIDKRVADSIRTAFRGSVARQLPAAAARAVDEMRLPTMYPAMKSILAGTDGTTWIERYTPPGAHVWHVLDVSGSLVGAVSLPANVTLQTASQNAIWAVETDDDGLQSVVRYRVAAPR